VNLSSGGQEIAGGGHFEVIARRFSVDTKSALDCFLRGQRRVSDCTLYSILKNLSVCHILSLHLQFKINYSCF
jgi:hypothetical protein